MSNASTMSQAIAAPGPLRVVATFRDVSFGHNPYKRIADDRVTESLRRRCRHYSRVLANLDDLRRLQRLAWVGRIRASILRDFERSAEAEAERAEAAVLEGIVAIHRWGVVVVDGRHYSPGASYKGEVHVHEGPVDGVRPCRGCYGVPDARFPECAACDGSGVVHNPPPPGLLDAPPAE